jgi:hypothetical protein
MPKKEKTLKIKSAFFLSFPSIPYHSRWMMMQNENENEKKPGQTKK